MGSVGLPLVGAKLMRVLYLATDAFGGRGGIAQYNRDFIEGLCSHPRCEEVVAIPRLIHDDSAALPARLTYQIPDSPTKLGFVLSAICAVLRKPGFQLVVCGHINLLPLAYLAHLWSQAPIVLLVYGIDAWTPHRSALVKFLVRRIKGFISISEVTKKRFTAWSGLSAERGAILYNAIDLSRYHPGPKRSELQQRYNLEGKTVLMTLGRMSAYERYKGFDEVIEALPEILKDCPNATYLIVGDGTDRSRLEEKVRHLGVDEHVVFTGYISEEEKVDHYRLADAYVMPSRGEGFGFVFLEAMACGVPVVASSVDGGREAVQNGSLGALVDPDDSHALKRTIVAALQCDKGVVPEGLKYFSRENFERKLHAIVDRLSEGRFSEQ